MAFKYTLSAFSQCMLVGISLAALGTSQLQEMGIAKESQPYYKDLTCPTWFIPVLHASNITFCECNDHQIEDGAIIECPHKKKIRLDHVEEYGEDELNVSLLQTYCITYNFITRQIILGLCPYKFYVQKTHTFYTIPSKISELNAHMCHIARREGELCSRCINGSGLGLFSRKGKCYYNCNHAIKWIGFIANEFIVPTLVFAVILLFKIPTNTGPLNGFLFVSQIISVYILLQPEGFLKFHSTSFYYKHEGFIEVVETFYTFWFNQLTWKFTEGICISNTTSALQVIALQYLSPLYMLFWIIIISISIKLYNKGCRLLNYLCRPFQVCMRRLAMNWDPFSSIVNTIATFIVLVYTKVLYISFTLIAPSNVYNQSGELPFKVMPFNSSIHFLSQEHLPYFCLALTMLTLFCVLPLIILFVLPMKCFARLLNRKPLSNLNWTPLHTFADAFMGCYKNRTGVERKECRYFGSLYLFVRFLYLLCLFFTKNLFTWLTLMAIPISMFLLFSVVQPYRKKWLNIIDSATFFLLTLATVLSFSKLYMIGTPLWSLQVLLSLPPVYFVSLVVYKIARVCLTGASR